MTTAECLQAVWEMRLGRAAVALSAVATLVGIPVASGTPGVERTSAPLIQSIEYSSPAIELPDQSSEPPGAPVHRKSSVTPTEKAKTPKAKTAPDNSAADQPPASELTDKRTAKNLPEEADKGGKTVPVQLLSTLVKGVTNLAEELIPFGPDSADTPAPAVVGSAGSGPFLSFETLQAFQGTGSEAMAKIKEIHLNVPELKLFMAAIQYRESNGQSGAVGPPVPGRIDRAYGYYQIMQKIWPVWSTEVFGEVKPQTPDNQQVVASYKMKQYWLEFKSWDMVAVAWFAGPPRVRQLHAGDLSVWKLSDGYTTVRQYVDNMRVSMEKIKSNVR